LSGRFSTPTRDNLGAGGDDATACAGPFDRPAIYDKIRAARAALADLVDAGLYARERSIEFEALYHFENVDAWLCLSSRAWQAQRLCRSNFKRAHASCWGRRWVRR